MTSCDAFTADLTRAANVGAMTREPGRQDFRNERLGDRPSLDLHLPVTGG